MIRRRAFLLSSVAAFAFAGTGFARARLRGAARRISLRGARAPIEVVEDHLGIPHVRARSKHDAFFGQGYLVARDRLFQMDLGYRRELGRLAEVYGPSFLPADRAARLFLYRGDIDAELASIPAEVLDCTRGYVAGVNARIAELEADPTLAPLEFGILGYMPMRWDVRDLVRMRGGEFGNTEDEVRRAQLQARGLLQLDHYMSPLKPAWSYTVPDGLDCAAVSPDDLDMLNKLAQPLPFSDAVLKDYDRATDRVDKAAEGSNAWTIAGALTTTGRPILANDPHLSIGGASPRHICHISAPGLDVIGGGAPGLPGIMQGHTDRFAFGRTNFHIDQADLFILRTREDNPNEYWHDGRWKPFEVYEDRIMVKGAKPETIVLRHSLGRPVIAQEPEQNRAVALASVNMLPGANMQFAIIAINLAHDWDSLREAFKLHTSPTNLHYADIDGNTGWHAIGFAPRRPKHDGLFPAPGDGPYDWTGILSVDEMPHIYNPKQGWIASANDMNLPPDYPYRDRIISFEWTDSFRHRRISEVLGAGGKHSIEQSVALQHDVQSLPARALLKMLPAAPSPQAAPAATLLKGWDCAVTADSGAALLYEMVMPEVQRLFREAVIPLRARDLITSVDLEEMLDSLGRLDPRLGADPAAARDALIDAALAEGWKRAVEAAGADPARWRWGDIHHVVIRNPLSFLPPVAAAFPPIEGGRSGGDAYTVMARSFRPGHHFNVSHGASYLMVADVGNWDNSRYLLLPGQSADPRSPHYRDFYDLWVAGAMQPMPFSRAAVDAHAVSRTTLEPAGE